MTGRMTVTERRLRRAAVVGTTAITWVCLARAVSAQTPAAADPNQQSGGEVRAADRAASPAPLAAPSAPPPAVPATEGKAPVQPPAASMGGTPPPAKPAANPLLLDDGAFVAKKRGTSEWYGGSLIIADAISMSTALIGVAANEYEVLFPVGVALAMTDGLLVHGKQGRWGTAALSMLLRIGAGVGGCAALPGCFNQERPSGEATAGLLGGLALAAAIDIAFLARAPIKKLEDRDLARGDRLFVRALPVRHGALFGVTYRF